MTGTQGTSIMLLPWELQLRSHICLCIHRLPPWYFFLFLDIAHCHGAMLSHGKEHHCWACWITQGWGDGKEGGETSRSALYFKVDQARAENSALRAKMRDFLPLQAGILESEWAHNFSVEKHWCHWGTWSAPNLALLGDRAQPLMAAVKHTHVSRTWENCEIWGGDRALCPSPAWAPQT